MKKKFSCSKEDELGSIAPEVLKLCGLPKVVAIFGEMGAGKTTFIKALCKSLGVSENVSSPTFSLVNEYKDRHGKSVFHFDFYRIQSLQEVYDLGYEEYFYSGRYCFVEWPEKILNLLPQDSVTVTMQVENGIRIISVSNERTSS